MKSRPLFLSAILILWGLLACTTPHRQETGAGGSDEDQMRAIEQNLNDRRTWVDPANLF